MKISTTAHPSPLIELRRVYKYYQLGEARITALKGIQLGIHPGEFAAIWGPSGSGKSTLCNLVGLLDTPSSGTVHLRGQDVTTLADDRRSEVRNKTIGFVFQGFNLIPVLSAVENVMLPLQIAGISSSAARQRALERLAEVGLAQHTAHRPAKLSGGQQQRVAIARALVADPALVIADEPTANLDSENAANIIDLMRQINEEHGTTFIFSTHDQRLLERVGRQILMRDGEIAEERTLEQPNTGRVATIRP
jgi:putative ABC transport system ATP-binding protein